MKFKELVDKSNLELQLDLDNLLKTQFSLRMQLGTQQLQNTSQIGGVRRDIARVRTAMNRQKVV